MHRWVRLLKSCLAIGAAAALGAAFLAAESAEARGRIRLGGSGLKGAKIYSGRTLHPQELHGCLRQEAALNRMSDEVAAQERILAAESQRIDESERQLTQAEAKVDLYSADSVDAYNRLVGRHRKLIEAHNAKLPGFNRTVGELNAGVDAFNAQCADRPYFEDDMTAARKALGLE